MRNLLLWLGLLLSAAELAIADDRLIFGVVPQQAASRLAVEWTPLIDELSQRSGVAIDFATAPDIPTFEKRLAAGDYDIAYMNPYHFTVFNQRPGYRALAHARNKRITGVLVVRRDAKIDAVEELAGKEIAFPSPAAFAASILVRGELKRKGIDFKPVYVSSHDSVYLAVQRRLVAAGGGVNRTLRAIDTSISDQLSLLMTTASYTPHAIAIHPRVEEDEVARIGAALIGLADDEQGRLLLAPLRIDGWQRANDSDWDDVRSLDIDLLDHLLKPGASDNQ
jgi:phosphonate transport system substrate-binding protein